MGTSFSHTLASGLDAADDDDGGEYAAHDATAMGGMAKGTLFSMTSAMALIWVPQPMPKEATVASRAKSTPSHFMFSPRSRAYMAPPCILPSLVRTRYFTAIRLSAYLVAMPNTPAIQHQNTAPGPPRKMAVPTPMMLPVPMVEARAVVRAWKLAHVAGGVRVAGHRQADAGEELALDEAGARRHETGWVPSSRTIMGMPQIKSSSQLMKLMIPSKCLSPLFVFFGFPLFAPPEGGYNRFVF